MCNKDNLVSYLYDDLDGAARAALERHLRDCAECREELAGMRAVRADLLAWTPRGKVLSFREESQRAVGAEIVRGPLGGTPTGIKTEYVDFGSLYYVELSLSDRSTVVQAIGLPVVDGVTACPVIAQRLYRDCQPAPASGSDSYADEAEEREVQVDHDGTASGAIESRPERLAAR